MVVCGHEVQLPRVTPRTCPYSWPPVMRLGSLKGRNVTQIMDNDRLACLLPFLRKNNADPALQPADPGARPCQTAFHLLADALSRLFREALPP